MLCVLYWLLLLGMYLMICDIFVQDQIVFFVLVGIICVSWYCYCWLVLGVIVLFVGIGWVVYVWFNVSCFFDSSCVCIVEVKCGDLVCDIVVDGCVIVVNSLILYVILVGMVDLKVVVGDVVKKGQELVIIDSLELCSKLVQEQVMLVGLEVEVSCVVLDVILVCVRLCKEIDQVIIECQVVDCDLQCYQCGYDGGVVLQIDLVKVKDLLKKVDIVLVNVIIDVCLQSQGVDLDVCNKCLLVDCQKVVVVEVQCQVDVLILCVLFDGQVGQVQVVQFINLVVNVLVLGVVDLFKFEVEIKVLESFVCDLVIGMFVQLIGGNGQLFLGEISVVLLEVVNGEVNVCVCFVSVQLEGLCQSQWMLVCVLFDICKDVLKVECGLFVEQGNGMVYVMDGCIVVCCLVELGVSSLGEVEIKLGVQLGDCIVVFGSDLFKDVECVFVN